MLNTNMAPSNHSKLGRVLITGGWHDNKNSSRYSGQSSVVSPRSSAQNVPFTLGADLPPAGRGEPGAVFEGERGTNNKPSRLPKDHRGLCCPSFLECSRRKHMPRAMMAHRCQVLTACYQFIS